MENEELICPNCGTELPPPCLKTLSCSTCKVNFRNKKFVGFLEYLMMNGLIGHVDFFDKSIYGEEINQTSETEEELRDETNPDEYEENRNKIEYMDKTEDLREVTTDEEEFRKWDGIDEDWREFNKKNSEE
tara:strand:+ start:118 stop:510 length:393 start_codon:yes stop_codon:yes gene_type:complete